MNDADELVHTIMHLAELQIGGIYTSFIGHIAAYDPATHRVQVIIPHMRDTAGVMIMTGWISLGSLSVGNGWGVQFAPIGGSTQLDPFVGEQCLLSVYNQEGIPTVCANLFFSIVMNPPNVALLPGEMLIKHKSGSSLLFDNLGNLNATSTKDTNITVGGNATLDVTGNLQATISGDMTASVTGTADVTASSTMTLGGSTITLNGDTQVNGTLVASDSISDLNGSSGTLATFRTDYNNHVHPGVTTGTGNTGTTSLPVS